ncbi:MAG: hypothetical protein QM572_02385 [Nocardioides sp.]|uniref:hypothetical protein n=1 Tax=Nocardioides sp. TaxID=35761 RepID=UPI0039E2316F
MTLTVEPVGVLQPVAAAALAAVVEDDPAVPSSELPHATSSGASTVVSAISFDAFRLVSMGSPRVVRGALDR